MKPNRAHKQRKPLNVVTPNDRVPPTPQTLAKHRLPALNTLHAAGDLTADHIASANEIAEVWLAITGGLWAKANDPQRASRSCGGMPDRLVAAYHERYLPWTRTLTAWARRIRWDVPDAMIALIVDGAQLAEVAARQRTTPRNIRRIVPLALTEYRAAGSFARSMARNRDGRAA